MIDNRIERLEHEIKLIKQRNNMVTADKAWETSKFRIVVIGAITYVVAATLLWLLDTKRFYLNALVPTVGFLLSSQSLPALKHWWIKSWHNNND